MRKASRLEYKSGPTLLANMRAALLAILTYEILPVFCAFRELVCSMVAPDPSRVRSWLKNIIIEQ